MKAQWSERPWGWGRRIPCSAVLFVRLGWLLLGMTLPGGVRANTPVLAPLPAEFHRFQQRQALPLLQATGKGARRSLGWVPLPIPLGHLVGARPALPLPLLGLPESYDLRSQGKMPPIRDQGSCGACWTFATCAALESFLRPDDTEDFSENHMKNTHGYDVGPCAGGNYLMSAAYFARWSGPVAEASDPYQESSTWSPVLPAIREVREMWLFPNRSGPLDNDVLKQAILSFGGVATAIRWEEDSYNEVTHAYCYTGSEESNHGVVLVGWDDRFPASAFRNPPPGNGAFLVRNSWGTEFGDGGYFYISYHDSRLETNAVFPVVHPAGTFESVFGYDPLGATGTTGYPGSTTGWMANVFQAAHDLRIGAVGFYTWEVDTAYEVLVHDQVTGSPRTGVLKGQAQGTVRWPGFHTVSLAEPALVTGGRSFSVVVKIRGTTLDTVLTVEGPVAGYSMAARALPGQSYLSPDGVEWTDLTSFFPNHNASVKAYSLPECRLDGDCDDQMPCTLDRCVAGRCAWTVASGWCRIDGLCIADGTWNGPCLACDGARNPSAWTYAAGRTCNDGNPCTAGDLCRIEGSSNADCQGTAYSCDDGLPCTADQCQGDGTCHHAIRDDWCLVGGRCVASGGTGGPCLECRPAIARDRWTFLEGQDCDDGNLCTNDDQCQSGGVGEPDCRGTPVVCDDGNPCTDDSCDPATGCRFLANAAPCDDGDLCTITACSLGECQVVAWREGCCHRLEDCGDRGLDCNSETNTCQEVACRLCTGDEACGAPGNRCVPMTSGNHCAVGCDPRDPSCPDQTWCSPLHEDTGVCLPIRGDCVCIRRARTACIDGNSWWIDSCGEPGEVAEDCQGRGCVTDLCCGEGFHERDGACVSDEGPEEPDREADLPDLPEDRETAPETTDAPSESGEAVELPEVPTETGPADAWDGADLERDGEDRLPEGPRDREVLGLDDREVDGSARETPEEELGRVESREGSSGGCTAAPLPRALPLVPLVLGGCLGAAILLGRRRVGVGHRNAVSKRRDATSEKQRPGTAETREVS